MENPSFNKNIKYDIYTVAKVLKAFLIYSQSHRQIQKEILGLPAPPNGGGFETMKILHAYGIDGNKKGLFRNHEEIQGIDINPDVRQILKELLESEQAANEYYKIQKVINKNNLPTEKNSTIRVRVFQDKLRDIVLQNYSSKCALCEIDKTDLLICSHIIPWSINEDYRLDPQNAICLCVLHDRLFDRGYFTLNEKLQIVISTKASSHIIDILSKNQFRRPIRSIPDANFLKYHTQTVYNNKKL